MGISEGIDTGFVDAGVAKAHAARAGLRVDADNVLYVRRAILDEYEILKLEIRRYVKNDSITASPYGGDPVSRQAAVEFPKRVARLVSQVQLHVDTLLGMAEDLEKAALAYGRTEAEIEAITPVMATSATREAWLAEVGTSIRVALNPWERP